MYHYNKVPRRGTKDGFSFGPQFSVQASATAVAERAPKQKESISLKQNDVISATNFGRSRSSSGGVETPPMSATPDRGMRNNNSKRAIMPSTAFGHDLTNAEPLVSDDERNSRSSHSPSVHTGNNTPVLLPGDRVIFAESPNAPGVPIVYRTPEERSANPDRLNLDRRRLSVCPILEGEEQLRLLNYQHNIITRIQHLSGLRRLIFLDLYDNQIEEISGLGALKSLRVLMLGKNRIAHIENLDSLTKLDVLDLHGNQIKKISNLNHLTELRVLNLAGNLIEHVSNLIGMDALTELNLRRNRIRSVDDLEDLRCLQRLFLSFNEILCFEDISCLADCTTLSEISLDGNPISQDPIYKKNVIRHMQQIRQLDMKRITDDERRLAHVMAKKEEEKKRETNKLQIMKERRQVAINNAKKQWEVMQGSLMTRTNKVIRNMPELYANHVANVPNTEVLGEGDDTGSSRSSSRMSRPPSAKSLQIEGGAAERVVLSQTPSRANSARSRGPPTPERLPQGSIVSSTTSINVDYLTEIDGDTLSLYGAGSMDAFEKTWGIQAAGAVTTIIFKFIDFDEIVKHLHKIRIRFPNVHTLSFNSTNICTLPQLNALSAVRRLDHLTIATDGNPIIKFSLWKTYILFRLAHFSLKTINDVEVSAADILNAEKFFGTMSHMTTSQLPQSRLLALLSDSKKKQLLGEDKKKPLSSEGRLTDRGTESVGRAGLGYTPPDSLHKESKSRKQFVGSFVKSLASEAIECDRKQAALQRIWPKIFYEMVQNAVVEMWDSNAYMKKCLEDLEKR